jgi:hypothetical protein
MTRPHIEFIHAQQLEWIANDLPQSIQNTFCKVLSLDPNTGGRSCIIQYPQNWHASLVPALSASHELLILDGSLQIAGQIYNVDDYAYLPAGSSHHDWKSETGATVLTFFSKSPDICNDNKQNDHLAVHHLDVNNMKWSSEDVDPDVAFLRISHKILRYDENTGDKTLLLNCGAQTHPKKWEEAALSHPCVEEMFLLSGDIIGERGIMYSGAYFWRPPNMWHGPFGSRKGNLCLIRFLEGHHKNLWSKKKFPFSLEPNYTPELPKHLEHLRQSEYKPTEMF